MGTEKKEQSPKEQFQKALTNAAGENSELRRFIDDFIELILIRAQQAAALQPEEKPRLAVSATKTPKQKDILPPEAEITDYRKYYQDTLKEFVHKVRQNPKLKDAEKWIFIQFLDNFEDLFIWSEKTFQTDSDLDYENIAEAAVTDKTIGVCAVIATGTDKENGDFVTFKSGESGYPVIAIHPYPISKQWAAILLLQNLLHVYIHYSLSSQIMDAQQREDFSYLMSINSCIYLIEYHEADKNLVSSLVKALRKRKIFSIPALAKLLNGFNLTRHEFESFEYNAGSNSAKVTSNEINGRQFMYNEFLMVTFIMMKTIALEAGEKTNGVLQLYRQLEEEMALLRKRHHFTPHK